MTNATALRTNSTNTCAVPACTLTEHEPIEGSTQHVGYAASGNGWDVCVSRWDGDETTGWELSTGSTSILDPAEVRAFAAALADAAAELELLNDARMTTAASAADTETETPE